VGALRAREFPWEARGDAAHFDHAAVGPLPERTRVMRSTSTRGSAPSRTG
jgi:hypothetical protein